MSPELETLDQLLGGDMPLALIRRLFPDDDRFTRAVVEMLEAGEVRLVDAYGNEAPHWRWRELLVDGSANRLAITEAGVQRIG